MENVLSSQINPHIESSLFCLKSSSAMKYQIFYSGAFIGLLVDQKWFENCMLSLKFYALLEISVKGEESKLQGNKNKYRERYVLKAEKYCFSTRISKNQN